MACALALSLALAAAISDFHLGKAALHPGVPLGHGEVSVLFFSAGPMFWVVLPTLVLNRLMFHDLLPGRMAPTLMILIAPPAVAYIAGLLLAGEPLAFGRILHSLGYVSALIVLTQPPRFRSMPFALSSRALSFLLAALSIASFVHAEAAQSGAHRMIGAGLLALLAAVAALLLARMARTPSPPAASACPNEAARRRRALNRPRRPATRGGALPPCVRGGAHESRTRHRPLHRHPVHGGSRADPGNAGRGH